MVTCDHVGGNRSCTGEKNSLQVKHKGVKHYAASVPYLKALSDKIVLVTPDTMRNNAGHVKEKKAILKKTF